MSKTASISCILVMYKVVTVRNLSIKDVFINNINFMIAIPEKVEEM